MRTLEFPKIAGGRVTDCVFDPTGAVLEIWIVLDANTERIEFVSEFNIAYEGKVHLNSVAGAVSK